MNRFTAIGIVVVILAATALSQAEEVPEFPKPEKEHQWLQKFVGHWKTTSKGSMGPDQPPMECTGTITAHMVGGFWVVNEMKSEVMGFPMQGVLTVGYDPTKKKYTGTWIDSMVNHLWHYEGTVDKTGKKLTLETEGPNFMTDGKLTKFRDAYEFKTADHILVTSAIQGDDGKWMTFMTGDAKRTKVNLDDQ